VGFLALFLASKPFRPYCFLADGSPELGLEREREIVDTEETFPRTDQPITSPLEQQTPIHIEHGDYHQ
jgi:hypothetical protein